MLSRASFLCAPRRHRAVDDEKPRETLVSGARGAFGQSTDRGEGPQKCGLLSQGTAATTAAAVRSAAI